ncbi:MAG: C-type lectin domain-containing protein [Labilithrix sp.]|nr:C-type lectin domain-containing protein [Labilithrix sp.]
MRRARRKGVAALALSVTGLAFACLPDLEAFPPGPETREAAASAQALGCGDGVIETLDDGGDAGESCDPGDAQPAGCEDCRFVCSGGIDDAGHCYFLADDTATYAEAVSACSAARGHLVTFASDRESAFASALVATRDADAGYWVGLTFDNNLNAYGTPPNVGEPGWPSAGSSCTGCFAVGADAGAFAPHGDDAGQRSRDCLVAERGTWLAVPCEGARPFKTLCEREPVGQRIYPCGGLLCTTIQATVGSKRYVIWQFPETADGAKALCETSYPGGSLVVFDSREEREQLVREIVQRLRSPLEQLEVWIGLSHTNGTWTWDDGRPADGAERPLPWGKGQPTPQSSGRAFLRVAETFDTQLAQSDEDAMAPAQRVFVCQRPVD